MTGMRRMLAGSTAAAIVATGLVALGLAQPAAACACGAPMPPGGTEVSVGEEHAIVSVDGGVERIDLVLDMYADGAETGLVMPTPAPATVSLGDRALFEALDRQMQPVVETRQEWWGSGGDGGAPMAGAPPEVLSEVDLGPVHAVTLAASDAAGLGAWLDENGYGIAPEVQALLPDYVARGWSFAALKLTGEVPLEGALDPIRFEFEVDEPVYPLLLSQAASIPQTVRLYLLGDDRIEPVFAGSPGGAVGGRVTWAGPVTEPALAGLGGYLTVYEAYFADPGGQILGDLALVSTGGREGYAPVVVRTEYVSVGPVPAGFAIVGAAALLTVLALAVVGMVLLTRRRAAQPPNIGKSR